MAAFSEPPSDYAWLENALTRSCLLCAPAAGNQHIAGMGAGVIAPSDGARAEIAAGSIAIRVAGEDIIALGAANLPGALHADAPIMPQPAAIHRMGGAAIRRIGLGGGGAGEEHQGKGRQELERAHMPIP